MTNLLKNVVSEGFTVTQPTINILNEIKSVNTDTH